MIANIQPGGLTGMVLAPASKSSMQRACAAALLRAGETVIHHPGYSNDDKAALRVIQALGAKIETLADGSLLVKSVGTVGATAGTGSTVSGAGSTASGTGSSSGEAVAAAGKARTADSETRPREVNCGESGLGLRMFAPIIALSPEMIRVVGEGSLLRRPMDFFDEIFPQLGIRVVSNAGKLPLEIQGPLQPRDIEIDGSLSSQFLTGLLFAFAAAGAPGVTIKVRDLKSKPYIDLTLQVMRQFGWEVGNDNYEKFTFPKPDVRASQGRANGPAGGQRFEYTVEGDWSGGAFLLVAGAIAGPITVRGLDSSSTQADKQIVKAVCDAGATFEDREDGMIVGPAGTGASGAGERRLKAFSFDATDCPDLFPPLVALAAYCSGTTEILGVSRLAHKESDRGLTLQEEFGKMGVRIELDGNRMLVYGGGSGMGGQVSGAPAVGPTGATVHSRHDHRIAMACAVAALKAGGPVTIEEADAINKSYPDFYEHLQKLGGRVNIQP